jgi:hypothetical protein
MYKDWVDKVINVRTSFERLSMQKDEIEKKIQILQCQAKELVEDGIDKFYSQRIFPRGKNHFNHLIYRLLKIVKGKSSNRYAMYKVF